MSQSIQDIQTEGNTQVQRVSEEGSAQISAAKEQAGRAQAEADRAEAARAKAEKVVESCIPDDTAVSGKPWTSKKIVDILCMPFEEIGNPVQMYPVEGYPLGVKVSMEPIQEGSGDPSPDNIRPITGRDAVSVTRCGRNLLQYIWDKIPETANVDGLTITKMTDGTLHVTGKKESEKWTYIFRVSLNSKESLTIPPGTYSCGNKVSIQTSNGNIHKWPVTLDTPIEIYGAYCSTNKAGIYDMTVIPAMVVGTTIPETVEPYTGSTTDIALPETVYGGEVYAVTGEVAETWGLVTLDGSEKWTVSGKRLDNKTDWYYLSSKIPNAVNASPNKGNEICSHYPHGDIANTNTVQGCAIVWGAIRVRWGDTIPDDVNSWKAYLASQYAEGTPVQVAYKLAEPVPFIATGTQPILALSGVNTIYTDADGVIVTGAEDPKHTITELKNAILSLGGNV